jgi:hypothetical protein
MWVPGGHPTPENTSALASSAPAAGLDFYHFQPLARHRLPWGLAPAWAAKPNETTLACGLLAWNNWGIDEYPVVPRFSFGLAAHAGARSDCTRERRQVAGFWSIPGAQPGGRLPVMQRHGAWPRRVECSTLPRFEVGHAAPPTLGGELCMPVGTIHGACERVLGAGRRRRRAAEDFA